MLFLYGNIPRLANNLDLILFFTHLPILSHSGGGVGG